MTLWIVLECGYEYGCVKVVGTFKTYDEAKKYRTKMMDEREEEDLDWIWYDVKKITFTP